MYICMCVLRLAGVYACTVCSVCIPLPLFTLCGIVCMDLNLFMSRLINEEIKVSTSQSRHKDIRTGIRCPAATFRNVN